MDDVSNPLQAFPQDLLQGHEDTKPFMDKITNRRCAMNRRISEDSNDQTTLKLSNLPNFYTVRSISVLLKRGAKLDVDKSIHYVEAVLDENGASNGVFLIRFLQPIDARDVRFKLNNLVLYGKLINVQVENKSNATTVITPEFEKRFEQFLISEQARINHRLVQIQKLHSQEMLSPQSAAAYDPAIEADLQALLKAIEESLIQPPSTSMIEDNVVIEKTEKYGDDDYDEEESSSIECIECDPTKAEPFEISSDSSSIDDCDAEESQPNIADERREPVDDVITVTSSEDSSNDIMDVNQGSNKNEATCNDKERSKIEIKWEQNEIKEGLQETLDSHDKTENDSFTNMEDNNNSNESTITNTISSTDSTDVTKTMFSDINEIVTSNDVSIAAKRKLDCNTDVGKGTASKISKSGVGPSDSSRDESGVSVENLKVPMLREIRGKKYYGLNPEFLDYLGLKLPLSYRISVIRPGLYESVNETKLREVFSMAGKIRRILIMDNNTAEILYDHPVEAVQAISMFDKRILYGKQMRVVMEYSDRSLPPGLSSIGKGFTMTGAPLLHVGAIAEQIELNEILSEMGRVKKTATKKSPFSYFYKNKAINSENCTKASSCPLKASEKANESESVFRFTVPGTGEPDEGPSDSEKSKNALKELNQILKDRGLIPKNSECKKVKDILSLMKSKTSVTDQSKELIKVKNMANTTVSTSNSIKCSPDVGSKTLNPNPGEKQNTKQQRPQTRQNVKPNNIPQTRNLAQPPVPPLVKKPLLETPNRPPFIPIPRIPLQSQPNFRPIRPTMQNTARFQHNLQQYTRMYGNMRPQHGRGGGHGAIGLVFQNLPPRISEQILSQKMLEVGDLDFCKFIGFGQAIVRFKNPQDSHRCHQNFHKSKVDGHIIDVFFE